MRFADALPVIRSLTELCRMISGSISNEHSFAAQLEAIYKYGTAYWHYTVFMSTHLTF